MKLVSLKDYLEDRELWVDIVTKSFWSKIPDISGYAKLVYVKAVSDQALFEEVYGIATKKFHSIL
jgi:hypothetical protein